MRLRSGKTFARNDKECVLNSFRIARRDLSARCCATPFRARDEQLRCQPAEAGQVSNLFCPTRLRQARNRQVQLP
jgi:hypothetical protein